MNKKLLATIMVSVILVLVIIFFFMFVIKKPVSKSLINENLSIGSDKNVSMSEIDRAVLAAPSSNELPPIGDADNVVGDLSAKVRLIVYENANDIYCAQLNRTLKEIKNVYGADVVFVFRPFIFSGDENSMIAAVAQSCAGEQGKFAEMRDLIIAHTESGLSNILDAKGLTDFANSLGLNKNKFASCLTNTKYQTAINAAMEKVKNSMVFGTPTTFINGELVVGARAFEDGSDSNGNKLEGLNNIVARHLQ